MEARQGVESELGLSAPGLGQPEPELRQPEPEPELAPELGKPELALELGQPGPELAPEPQPVMLVSEEGHMFEVAEQVALLSPTLRRMIGDGRRRRISLPNIPSKVLTKVIQFAENLVDSRAAAAAAVVAGDLEAKVNLSWCSDFVRVDPTSLTKLILAADYLEMEELLHLVCERAAEIMVGRTPEEIQKMFSLKCVVTPAEEAGIRAKNKWAYE